MWFVYANETGMFTKYAQTCGVSNANSKGYSHTYSLSFSYTPTQIYVFTNPGDDNKFVNPSIQTFDPNFN